MSRRDGEQGKDSLTQVTAGGSDGELARRRQLARAFELPRVLRRLGFRLPCSKGPPTSGLAPCAFPTSRLGRSGALKSGVSGVHLPALSSFEKSPALFRSWSLPPSSTSAARRLAASPRSASASASVVTAVSLCPASPAAPSDHHRDSTGPAQTVQASLPAQSPSRLVR